jgi:hypothetical protein
MTPEQKAEYRKLCRQVSEAYDKLCTNGYQIKGRSTTNFNMRLRRIKDFMIAAYGVNVHPNNRWMSMNYIEERPAAEGCGALAD